MLSCVLIRHFAAFVERRHNPGLNDTPLILTSKGQVRRVIATSREPARQGVAPKMTLKQAQLLCPDAAVLPANAGAYERQADVIAESLMQFAAKVEREYQPMSTAFYLKTDTETDAIQRHVEEITGTLATVGVASNKLTARVAAAYRDGAGSVIRVPEGDEANFLAPHPVTLLPISNDMARRLPLLGIHTLGQYAALPKLAAWEQFDRHGKWLHDLARGIDIRPIQAFQPPRRLDAHHNFDGRIEDREILRAVLRRIGSSLNARLDEETASRLSLTLWLDGGRVIEAHTQPHAPVGDLLALMRHLNGLLDRQAVDAPVTAIAAGLADIQVPKPRQISLFDHMENQRRLETALPDWMARHREAGFYYCDVRDRSALPLPEDRFVLKPPKGA